MKIKFTLYTLSVFFMLASCSKERTCVCVTTGSTSYTDTTGATFVSYSPSQTETTVYKKTRKSKLGYLCGKTKTEKDSAVTRQNKTVIYKSSVEKVCAIQ